MTTGSTPTARAYWDLKAEQVMDRVFANAAPPPRALSPDQATAVDDSIEVEVREAPPTASAGGTSSASQRARPSWPVAALIFITLGVSTSLWLGWRQASQDLRQERTIRLLEGLREVGSASGSSSAAQGAAQAAAGSEPLPPPPPTEPWIEELNQLGSSDASAAPPLQVPVSGTLRAVAPPATQPFARPLSAPPPLPSGLDDGVPELVGVVQIPGRPGSAIFQMGGSSTNAGTGEAIGSSGWRLVSTNGDSAVIERGGISRRVSISSGF